MDDEWAITNFLKEFKKKKGTLSKEDLELIEPLVKKFKDMKIEELPHCFVHGDIIVTNVMKDSNDKLWIIDFSVSNYYPRIQELAVLACNLFFDEDNKEESDKNMKIALEEYQKKIQILKNQINILTKKGLILIYLLVFFYYENLYQIHSINNKTKIYPKY